MNGPVSRLSVLFVLVAASGCATSYQARGLVLKVDPATSTLTVSHEAIVGFMEPMVMPFAVRDPRVLSTAK